MRPKRATAAAMIRSVGARCVTSPLTASTAGSPAGAIVRDTATTAQPCCRYAATRPAPMPCEPPVMIATLRSGSLMASPCSEVGRRLSRLQELAPAARQRGLADLDQVPVRVAEVAADLGLVLLRWGQELSASPAPLRVHGVDVGDPDVEEAAGHAPVARGLESDGRLVVGRAATGVDDDPAVGERHVRRLARPDGGATQHVGVEAPGTLHVIGDEEVGQAHLVAGPAAVRHLLTLRGRPARRRASVRPPW